MTQSVSKDEASGFDADLLACAGLVERGDGPRFRTVMAAPVGTRPVLFALYAFNVEVARAPWVTQEPMIAEMRLQWWRDALEDIALQKTIRRHEVVTPLSRLLSAQQAEMLDELVAARRWDCYKEAFEDQGHFQRYIDQTAGHLMVTAAQALGTAEENTVRDVAFAAGVAAWFQAVPALAKGGRVPMIDGRAEAVVDLAKEALARLKNARKHRSKVSKASRPALWPVVGAQAILNQVIVDPYCVAEGEIAQAPAPLAWVAMTGRW